jgi:hypothetical protein
MEWDLQVTDHPQRECEEGRNIEAQSNCETEDWSRQQDFSWCLSNQAVTKRSDLEFGETNLQRDHPQNEKMPGEVKQQPSSTWSLQLQDKILEGDWIPPPHSAVIIEELSSCTSKQECSNNSKQSDEGEWILPHIAVVIEELYPCTSKQEGRDSKQCGGLLAIKELVESSKVEEQQHHKEACHKENVQLVDCASEAVLRTAESTNLRSQGDDGVTKSGKTCARDSLQSQEESFHLAQTCTTHQDMDMATGDSLCSDGCTKRDTVSADPIGEQMPDTEDVTLMMTTQKMLKDGLHTHERSHQRQEAGRSSTDEHTRVGTSRVASRIKVDGERLQADETQEVSSTSTTELKGLSEAPKPWKELSADVLNNCKVEVKPQKSKGDTCLSVCLRTRSHAANKEPHSLRYQHDGNHDTKSMLHPCNSISHIQD